MRESTRVDIFLVEVANNLVVKEGFQTSNTQTIRTSGRAVQFSGLKLSKMSCIKLALREQLIRSVQNGFKLRVVISNRCWDSIPFKIVSSCTQLLPNIKEAVRPPKKNRDGSTIIVSDP